MIINLIKANPLNKFIIGGITIILLGVAYRQRKFVLESFEDIIKPECADKKHKDLVLQLKPEDLRSIAFTVFDSTPETEDPSIDALKNIIKTFNAFDGTLGVTCTPDIPKPN